MGSGESAPGPGQDLYNNLGVAYDKGDGVERDMKKATYYWEVAAMGGEVMARHNLGALEADAGNMERAVKHWMISAGAGDDISLKSIRQCYSSGYATKDDFEKARASLARVEKELSRIPKAS